MLDGGSSFAPGRQPRFPCGRWETSWVRGVAGTVVRREMRSVVHLALGSEVELSEYRSFLEFLLGAPIFGDCGVQTIIPWRFARRLRRLLMPGSIVVAVQHTYVL